MPTPAKIKPFSDRKDQHKKLVEACLQQMAITRARLKREKAQSVPTMSLADFAAEIEAERVAMRR